ncbi:MAG: DUF2490 domain-containing protein [Saprospiraceae bacterium]|nr:DUF2490 domain-containing protein [Candidatus Opimibacter iunctus]
MSHKRFTRLIGLCFAIWFCAPGLAHGQMTTKEFWPEVDIWYRLSPSWRLSMYVPLSKNIETKYREGSIVLQADYAWGKSRVLQNRRLLDENRSQQMKVCLTRGGYLAAKSIDDNGEAYQENMIFFEEHFRTPFKAHLLVSHRIRSDLRWVGEENEFSYRIRYRLLVEREWQCKRVSLVPFVNIEPYYDSRYETINRVRYIGGTSIAWTPRIAVEGNLTYQHDTRSSVTDLFALNIILHVFFETKKARKPNIAI